MSDPGEETVSNWTGNRRRLAIPAGRDPFVNTPLLAVGAGPDGAERFWISSWNANVGCLAALVTETGDACIHRFEDSRHGGFYSAVQENDDILWLCGDLSRVLRFSLGKDRFDEYETGAPSALVFQGMAFDPETHRLFALAHDMVRRVVSAFSFDTIRRETAKIHYDFAADKYMRCHFPNGDGSYSFVLHIPGETLLRWNPREDTLEAERITEELDVHARQGGTTYTLLADERGRRYFPGRGWYHPLRRNFDSGGPCPEREMTWFGGIDRGAWGAVLDDENLKVGRWDMNSGEVRELCVIPDCTLHNINVTSKGKIVAVNKYGYFHRFDGKTGALEMTKRLESDSIGRVDCLCRIDEKRLLGTPFITQRFWEIDVQTGMGYDCGRAAPGGGEVLRTWRLGGKIYMAAYAGGQLVEYDPAHHPHFPENPRVVAAPPHAMRPVASADDGRHIFYACSTPYGTLGSTVTKYDTATGRAFYSLDPLPGQQIVSCFFESATNSLLCGTTPHADCHSREPSSDRCYFARIDTETLTVIEKVSAPEGATSAMVEGPLGGGDYLCRCLGLPDAAGFSWFTLHGASLDRPERESMWRLPPETSRILYAGKPGFFLLQRGARLERWDMRRPAMCGRLADAFDGYAVKVQDDSVYLLHPREIEILEGCLR